MEKVKSILSIILTVLMGGASVIFAILYIDAFGGGFISDHAVVLKVVSVGVITLLTIVTLMFGLTNKDLLFKVCVTVLFLIMLAVLVIYLMQYFNILEKFKTKEDFQRFIKEQGNFAVFTFIAVQFLQVVVLPIPSVVTVGAGVLLFGPWFGGFLSFVGIFFGSLVAFLIGKYLGYKAAAWIVGKESLDKWLNKMKGKDKLLLTFMFLMPFFPDDLLCFVAGLSTMSVPFFIIMIAIVRLITIYATSFTLNGSIIPFNTWWGITIWVILFALVVAAFIIVLKYGDKIESYLGKKFKRFKKKR